MMDDVIIRYVCSVFIITYVYSFKICCFFRVVCLLFFADVKINKWTIDLALTERREGERWGTGQRNKILQKNIFTNSPPKSESSKLFFLLSIAWLLLLSSSAAAAISVAFIAAVEGKYFANVPRQFVLHRRQLVVNGLRGAEHLLHVDSH